MDGGINLSLLGRKINTAKKLMYQTKAFDELIKRDITTNRRLFYEDKNKIWVFNAGNTFAGNPKWLFIYINKYRKDIDTYWLCDEVETVDYVRSLGYKAYLFGSGGGLEAQAKAGVFVTEQVKEIIPPAMKDAVLLNLYHGVGCKTIERKVDTGFLVNRLVKKCIKNNNYYFNNMLFLVTSPLMEKHFKEQVGLADDRVIRAGYPRCVYQQYFEKIATYDHDILKQKGRNRQTKIIAYSPTYRDNKAFDFINNAIPDMDALEKKLKENNLLFVFKMHPFMEQDINYLEIKEKYKNSPYFYFWNNLHDFYEIMDQIDLAIVDYSSIFYDFLAAGVKNFVRYFFDYGNEENLRGFAYDCKEMTCGKIAENFDDFLKALDNYEPDSDETAQREKINDLFWQYSSKDSMDVIIDTALKFKPGKVEYPTLYSFDIFDTIISRKGLNPKSIFFKVREKLDGCGLFSDKFFITNYPEIRAKCEANAREYEQKTMYVRKSDTREITFNDIFERMQSIYSLSEQQVEFLKTEELNAEYDDCIPIPEEIAFVESLIEKGEKVVLISDMYLPKDFIVKMLNKVSSKIASLPFFLSCDYGVQKTTGKLFIEVYRSFSFFDFGTWCHFGDNQLADKTQPNKLAITCKKHNAATFNDYEQQLVDTLGTYDSYLVAALMARFRAKNSNTRDYFCYAYASLCFVPYVFWAVKDAKEKGIDTLYFISRDGHHLKRIADTVISALNIDIKTKYIYGSRKAWRIPSFVNEFDESFFLPFGNVASATSYKGLLKALSIDDKTFSKIFPNLSYIKNMKTLNKDTRKALISIFSESTEYKNYLLNFAKEKRGIIDEYFKQEMDLNEKFAFVEYWGRGYTQTCHTRLLQNVAGKEMDVPYYYLRSIYPTEGNDIRYNYTSSNASLIFVEALFANIDYKSIEEYQKDSNGIIGPVFKKADCDMQLLDALNLRLIEFCRDLVNTKFDDIDCICRELLHYSLSYFSENQDDEIIIENIAPLVDAVGTFGEKREFAPVLTKDDVDQIAEKQVNLIDKTSSMIMSLARSDKEVRDYYEYLTEVKPLEMKLDKKGKKERRGRLTKNFENYHALFNYKVARKKNQVAYDKFANKPIQNLVVFVGKKLEKQSEFKPLAKYFKSIGVEVHFANLKNNLAMKDIRKIAVAKGVFLCENSRFFSLVKLRKQTKLVQLFMSPFPLNKFGYQVNRFGIKSSEKRNRILFGAEYSLITCAGEKIKKIYRDTLYTNNNKNAVIPLGSPVTDCYFEDKFRSKAISKLEKAGIPTDKNIILYMPNTTAMKKSGFDYLQIEKMKNILDKNYILLVLSNNSDDIISAYTNGFNSFAYNVNGILNTRQAMAVADIICGDFTDIIFEGVLTEKPMFFTSPYFAKPHLETLFNLEEITFAPIANDTEQLINLIINVDNYDYSKYNDFRQKYLGSCDGNSTKRIADFIK